MRNFLAFIFFCFIFGEARAIQVGGGDDAKDVISLAGIWNFKLDPMDVSIPVKGSNFVSRFPEEITLPGSTDQAGKGFKTQDMTSIRLTRMYEYSGAAWYEKSNVFIPEEWTEKQFFLFLERVHWESQVWVNGHFVGKDKSLATPHRYDITPYVKVGDWNTVRIRVDNSKIHDLAYTHAMSAETQTNWNGIIGRMEIQAVDKVHISDLQVYPMRKEKKLKVVVRISNADKAAVEGNVCMRALVNNADASEVLPEKVETFQGNDSVISLVHYYELGDKVYTWDEFNPNLYQFTYEVKCGNKSDSRSISVGVRDFATRGTNFTVNDITAFIRGAVNSCEFPITGYPPMDYNEWMRVMTVYKDYGINCIRFHSWCPPEEAFRVADELGLYLQVENADWRFTVGDDKPTNDFYYSEVDRIFQAYGNHPSFAFFCEGNELVGKGCKEFLNNILAKCKKDSRHLYVAASGYPTIEGSDFYDFYGARPQRWQEGLKGRFNVQPLNTRYDYSDYVKKFTIPMITHEVGQWCVYPDYNQIPKYVGVLKPFNYELFREDLRNKKMLHQADDFHMASGKFQVIQKKEEFESYFRTPGFGGYHLLQLNDFPGQGTSPVGVVDVFYDAKPYVDAETFASLQSPCLPLMRTDKLTWTNNETFQATAQIANFYKADMNQAEVNWTLAYPDGAAYAKGSFKTSIPNGGITELGVISVDLHNVTKATKMVLTMGVAHTKYKNKWDIWVYPSALPKVPNGKVMVAREWNARVKKHLDKGGDVLLLADTAKVNSDVPPCFSGISWNAVWSGTPPNTLGILCNPQHSLFNEFPTEFHSNWQWFDLIRNSRPMLLDQTSYALTPLVQIIPDWNNNRKIGLIFEAKVGRGRLMVTSIAFDEILPKSAVARQMYYSMMKYITSSDFNPKAEMTFEMVDKIFY